MKTFSEFLEESYACLEEKTAAERMAAAYDRIKRENKLDRSAYKYLVKAGKKSRGPDVDRAATRLSGLSARERAEKHREENIRISTPKLTEKEEDLLKIKREKAEKRKKDLHHINDVKTSGDTMRNMSQEERSRHRGQQAGSHNYYGDHPRNLALADNSDKSEFDPLNPGFHHNKYHSFEKRNRNKLSDIPIDAKRAFTTLVNRERRAARREKLDKARRERTLPKLQARINAAADREGID